jgi:hypothetical protein
VVREPGDLQMLPRAGLQAWRSEVERLLTVPEPEEPQRLLIRSNRDTPHTLASDWTGLPQRVVSCIGRQAGLGQLDWSGSQGDEGRRRLQEEYLEWRTVRYPDGLIRRVELTTELPEYWATLAAYAPAALLTAVADFAQEDTVDSAAVFGTCNPFGKNTAPEDRRAAFIDTMLSAKGTSPYNSGAKAICCMVQSTNTLGGLAALAHAALRTYTVIDEHGVGRRCLSADDVLPLMRGLAQPDRASDPLLVERLTRLAWDGRLVAFDDPIGIYVQGVEYGRLRSPAGTPIPPDWFQFSRGTAAPDTPDRRARWQRMTFEVPENEGYAVGDLIDVATETPISFGGQIAELLQVSVYLRVSDPGVWPVEPYVISAPEQDTAGEGCDEIRDHQREYVA